METTLGEPRDDAQLRAIPDGGGVLGKKPQPDGQAMGTEDAGESDAADSAPDAADSAPLCEPLTADVYVSDGDGGERLWISVDAVRSQCDACDSLLLLCEVDSCPPDCQDSGRGACCCPQPGICGH